MEHSRNHHCYRKALSKYSECVCVWALIIQYAKYVRHIVEYYYLWPVWFHSIFPLYLINSRIFGKRALNIKRVFLFSLQLSSETFLILRRTQHNIITNVDRFSHKCTRYSCHILMKLGFSWHIFKKILKNQILWKFSQWEWNCSMQTDMTKLTVVFHNVVNTHTNSIYCMGCKWSQNNESHILSIKLYIRRSSHNWRFLLTVVILAKI